MNETVRPPAKSLSFDGYYRKQTADPDLELCAVGRGTPGGEYHRRFWQPIAYLHELGDLPLKARALGEDLVVFKDGRGEVGVLHLHCCHRNTSLEYGLVEQRGIRCCYHGRLFDTDGSVLEMPGDPAEQQLKCEVSQGGYPTHLFGGIVFVYMGPPERIPAFPKLDRLEVEGIQLVPGVRFALECNWLQIKENALDPHHTHVLHAIPFRREFEHFSPTFGEAPELSFMETPGGFIYLGARRVGDNLWVRSAETWGPNIHCISSIFESGAERKYASRPFMTFWTLPVDDENSVTFYVSHVSENEPVSFERRRELEIFGQTADRPYRDRQYLPGDHEAQVSQGPINPIALEHLGTHDRGITMFRRYIRRGIRAVHQGLDPMGFYMNAEDLPPTFANDCVVSLSVVEGSPEDPAAVIAAAEKIGRSYLERPPIKALKESLAV